MKRLAKNHLILTLLCYLLCYQATAFANSKPPAEVMLFGVFHFANPGKDVVKTEQIHVMTEENQAYLESLAKRIAQFKPTVVLLEFNPENESEMQERYQRYLAGELPLSSNEVYQLGFRIAKLSGVKAIYSFDDREIGWKAEELFQYMPEHAPQAKAKLDAMIEEITVAQDKAHATSTLAEILTQTNDPMEDNLNKYFYLVTNDVGAGENFVGADAAASWWHRNFRLYANIQKHAQPGERVLAIGGQGHTAILKDLLALDRGRVGVDIRPYLGK